MAVKKTSKKTTGKQTSPAQEALQITFVLKGNLKRAQLMYLFIARQLADVRDRSLYAALGHKDMEDYAHQRLDLGRSSLYNYLHIYDWVKQSHPEWLGKNVKGKIPDLSDVANLMWIESTLAAPTFDPAKRTEAEALRKKALAGTLNRGKLKDFKDTGKPVKDQLEAMLTSLRSLREKAGKIPGMPPEALSGLDAVINIVGNEKVMKVADLHLIRPIRPPDVTPQQSNCWTKVPSFLRNRRDFGEKGYGFMTCDRILASDRIGRPMTVARSPSMRSTMAAEVES